MLLLFFGISITAPAQQKAVTVDSTELAFLPAIAYNSDLGLILGGIGSRYSYKKDVHPFYSYLHLNALFSTKGLISSTVLFDKPDIFESNQRLTSELYVSRFLENQYYGIGNYAELPNSLKNSNYYLYKSFSTGIELTLRRPIIAYTNGAHLDAYGLAVFDYRTPWGNNANRLIIAEQPQGVDGSRASALGAGVIWENRDNEFAPTSGTYVKTGVEFSHRWLGSSTRYFRLNGEARSYATFHLIRDITFANRLSFAHSAGTLPYWKLPELGGEDSMRGYPENRFRDQNALFLNSELRTWLIEFKAVDVRLGGTIFFDVGRTFPNSTSLKNVFNDLKYTFGFGGNSSFFTNDFILRGDIGFSEEGYGIYFTAGYMF